MDEYGKTITKVSIVAIPIGILNIALTIASWLSGNAFNWKFFLTLIPLAIGMALIVFPIVILIEYYLFGEEL